MKQKIMSSTILRNETGRSMVEMLGVLAVMGVLSVGAVEGYHLAKDKHRSNETIYRLMQRANSVSAAKLAGFFGSLDFDPNDGFYVIPNEINDENPGKFGLTVKDVPERVCLYIKDSMQKISIVMPDNCVSSNNMLFIFNDDMSSQKLSDYNDYPGACQNAGNKYCADRSLCVSSSTDCCNGFEPSECATACENETVTFVPQRTPCSNSEGVCDGKGKCDLCAPKINSHWNTLCYSCNPETGEITFNDQKRGVSGDQGCCQGFLRGFNNIYGAGACSDYGNACGLCNFGICLAHYQGYVSGLCEYGAKGSGCASDEHCDSGLKCVKASGSTYGECTDVTHPEHYCQADENCNEGYLCYGRTCTPTCESFAECSGENVLCGLVIDYDDGWNSRTIGPVCYSCPTGYYSVVESNGNKFCCDFYGYEYQSYDGVSEVCCTDAGGALVSDDYGDYYSCCHLDENGNYDGYEVAYNYMDPLCCDAAGGYMNEDNECVL